MKKLIAWLKKFFSVSVPQPAPPSPTVPVDAIPLDQIIWLHASPAFFPITATLKNITVLLRPSGAGPTIGWEWTHPQWPVAYPANGVGANMWVMFRHASSRVWYAATWEWLRVNPATTMKTTEAQPGQPPFVQAKAAPTDIWYPASGEEVGWMISTPCRDGCVGPVTGRSPIVISRWP